MQRRIALLAQDGEKVLNWLDESENALLARDLDVRWLLSRRWVRLGTALGLLRVPRSVIPVAPAREKARLTYVHKRLTSPTDV